MTPLHIIGHEIRSFAERPVGLLASSLGTLGAGTLNWLQWIGANAGGITVLCTVGGLLVTALLNLRRNQREVRESEARMRREQIEHEARMKQWRERY